MTRGEKEEEGCKRGIGSVGGVYGGRNRHLLSHIACFPTSIWGNWRREKRLGAFFTKPCHLQYTFYPIVSREEKCIFSRRQGEKRTKMLLTGKALEKSFSWGLFSFPGYGGGEESLFHFPFFHASSSSSLRRFPSLPISPAE